MFEQFRINISQTQSIFDTPLLSSTTASISLSAVDLKVVRWGTIVGQRTTRQRQPFL